MSYKYNVVRGHPVSMFRSSIDKDVLPTPRLLDEGTRGPVEAYRESEYQGRGVWRVRDDSYDPPGTEYTTIMVEVEKEKDPWD